MKPPTQPDRRGVKIRPPRSDQDSRAVDITEHSLRNDLLHYMFRGEVGRDYWARKSSLWGPNMGRFNRRGDAFKRIVDGEYAKAVAGGPPTVAGSPAGARPKPQAPANQSSPSVEGGRLSAVSVGSALAVGIVLGVVARSGSFRTITHRASVR
ncbi:DUF6082 family protein [Nocardia sp. CA2R105]|uniref:DUF6082 family protein n=1 Tax=Nocardia coffeae TaxID=2873381 RepID=UPI001CA68DEE|nr:DUF6082 family protein [Nocardia coffeae]